VTARARIALTAACLVVGGAAAAPAGADAHRGYATERDLSYDLGSPPPTRADNLLDLYRPRGLRRAARRPVVVWIHGGGWRKGDKRIGARKKAALFTGRGYLFASLNYRLSPAEPRPDPERPDPHRIRFPDHPADVGEALGWLRRNVAERGGDPRRFVLMGHSAGAHLAALVATDPGFARGHGVGPRRVRAFVSLDSPAFDIAAAADPGGDRHRASREMLWNAFATPGENVRTSAWELGSPLRFAGPPDPPGLLVTQAGIDERVGEAHRMVAALGGGAGSRVLAVGLDHREINHALGERPDPSGVTDAVLSFVRRHARGANAR
jgi:acetyl esterase/lipase